MTLPERAPTHAATRVPRPSLRTVVVGTVCTVVFLFLASRGVDWQRTAAALHSARWTYIALGTCALIATHMVFALRWRVLLRGTLDLPVADSFSYIMIGYLANTVLPLRLGDATRAVLLARSCGRSSAQIFASIVLERTLDVLTLLLFTLALSFIIDMPPAVRLGVGAIAVVSTVAFGVLVAAARGPGSAGGAGVLPARIAAFLRGPAAAPVVTRARSFIAGLTAVRSGPSFLSSAALSVAAWLVMAVATSVFIAAFRLPVPWYAGAFVLVVINLGSSIPSSPGFIGVYHFLAVLALSQWVHDRSAALAYAIGTHALNIAVNMLLGSLSVARQGLSLRIVRSAATPKPAQ